MSSSVAWGMLFGIAAALSQSLSYIFSRLYVIRHPRAPGRLLVLSHLMMGLGALLVLPFAWTPEVPPLHVYIRPLLGTACFYAVGQAGLFILMRRLGASRVAPLLGFKIVVLAFIVVVFMHEHLSLRRGLAVLLCFAATLMLGYVGARMSRWSVVCLLVTCTGYSLSDLSIQALTRSLEPLNRIHAAVYGAAATYVLCGIAASAVALILRRGVFEDWRIALPFAAAWFVGMIFLFACFGAVGAVFGNILQSTRGLMSVVISAILVHRGMHHLDDRMSRGQLARRVAVAALMTLAIVLYVTG
ncbi:EamA family transporter [Verrucomicrobiota bacterium]